MSHRASEWQALAPKTQADYARVLDHLRPLGDFKADNVRRQHVISLRNKIGTNTRTQDLFVAAVRKPTILLPWVGSSSLSFHTQGQGATKERAAHRAKSLPLQRTVGQELAAIPTCGPGNEDALITRPGSLVDAGSHASEQDRFCTTEPEVARGKARIPSRAIKSRPHKLGSDTSVVAR